jgi:hypothetical protein
MADAGNKKLHYLFEYDTCLMSVNLKNLDEFVLFPHQ